MGLSGLGMSQAVQTVQRSAGVPDIDLRRRPGYDRLDQLGSVGRPLDRFQNYPLKPNSFHSSSQDTSGNPFKSVAPRRVQKKKTERTKNHV